MLKKKCKFCKKLFYKTPNTSRNLWFKQRRFCCKKCKDSYPVPKRIRNIMRKLVLGKQGPLARNWQGGKIMKYCNTCQKPFYIFKSLIRVNHCSNSCSKKGSKSYSWKGGITAHNQLERRKFIRTIRIKVLERDNYTCQICEGKEDLQVDHIQPWAEYVELRFNINNCRTLCAKCHYQITFGKPMPNTLKSWGHQFSPVIKFKAQ